MSRFDWQPDDIEGYTADAGDMVSLDVVPDNHSTTTAKYLGGACKWMVNDCAETFYLDGHADNVEQGKRRAEYAYSLLIKNADGHYQLRDFANEPAAIAAVETIP